MEGTWRVCKAVTEMKILNISNSHGQDSTWLVPTVLRREVPDQDFLVANLYQAYALTEHIRSIQNREANHFYYTNIDGVWRKASGFSIKMALKAEHWDVIMFNESSRHLGLEGLMSQGMVDWFLNYILENLDYKPVLLYNMTWANPTDDRLYEDTVRQRATATFKNTYTAHYGYDHINHYNKLLEMTQKYVVGHGFDKIILGAKPILYAGEVLGVPQYDPVQKLDLYRDYTHISDFARLMVAYQWYCQMFDIPRLAEVNVDMVPAEKRAMYIQQKLPDLEITEKHKEIIIKSVNEALKDPLCNSAKIT